MEIPSGKLRGLKRMADTSGRFKMLAVDQRAPLLKMVAERGGNPSDPYPEVARIKAALVNSLAGRSSAVLVDPDYGYSEAEALIPAHKGLLMTAEDFRFEESEGGRKSRLFPGWDIAKIKRMGADGVKLLLWYRADAEDGVKAHQQELARQVGEACREYDIAFLLELLVYPFKGADNYTTEYLEDTQKRPDLVIRGLRDFTDVSMGVDIFKVETPIPAAKLPDPDASDSGEAQAWFDKVGEAIDRPWVMLSAGAGMEEFRRILTYAYRSGASGFLAGRAIWGKAFQDYPDIDKAIAGFNGDSAAYMDKINGLTDQSAAPWSAARHYGGTVTLAGSGLGFPASYPGFPAAKGGH